MEKEFEKVAEATETAPKELSANDYVGIKVGRTTARYLHLLYVTLPKVYDEYLEILEDEYTTDAVDKKMSDFCNDQYEPMKEYLVNNGLMNHFDDVANNLGEITEL